MRGVKSAFFAYAISLPHLALGGPPAPGPADPRGGKKGMIPPAISTTTSTKEILSSTVLSSTLAFQTSSAIPSITFQTIVETSSMTSDSFSTSAYTVTSVAAASPNTAIPSSTLAYSALKMSSTSSIASNSTSYSSNRKLVVILSCVLGFLGLLLIAGTIVLIIRYRRRQAPFGRRGVSPIDDEEIASWRRSEQEKRQQDLPPEHRAAIREVPELSLEHHSSGWTWATTPASNSIHTIPSSFPSSPAHSLSYVAPNARVGLTDETLPGADPFITPPKRHNSRLSKLPPRHSRTRSGRSSFSAKSMLGSQGHSRASSDLKAKDRSPTWHDNYDDRSGSHGAYLKESDGIGFPRISMLDDLKSGGLSPRPQSVARTMTWERIDDIGRAIA